MSSITIVTMADFNELLRRNPGKIVIKYGATWCGPCKKIQPLVTRWFSRAPEKVCCVAVDVDESDDIYSFLKHKKMVRGIPAIHCYDAGNTGYVPDDMVIGSNETEINIFFHKAFN